MTNKISKTYFWWKCLKNINSINDIKLFIFIWKPKNHQNTPKLFPPVFEKQEMSNLGHFVELWQIFFTQYTNATHNSEVSKLAAS